MSPFSADPLLYALFKGHYTAAQAREATRVQECRNVVRRWAGSRHAWSHGVTDVSGRVDMLPRQEVTSQATSCKQTWRLSCSVDTFLKVARDGGGSFLQVPTLGYSGGRGERTTGEVRSRVVEVINDDTCIVHAEGFGGRAGGEALWERVLLWRLESVTDGDASIMAWPLSHPAVPPRKAVYRDREILYINISERVTAGGARGSSPSTTVNLVTMNLLPKPYRFLPKHVRHEWAAARAGKLLQLLQQAMMVQRATAPSNLGAMVGKMLARADKGLAQELDMECAALEALARESPVKWEEVRPDAVNLGSVAHSVQSELELATFEMQKMLQQLQMRRTDDVGPRPDAAMPSPSYQALFHRSCQGCDLSVPKGTKLFRAQARLQNRSASDVFRASQLAEFWSVFCPVPRARATKHVVAPCTSLRSTQVVLQRVEQEKGALQMLGKWAGAESISSWRGLQVGRTCGQGEYLVVILMGTELAEKVLANEEMPAAIRSSDWKEAKQAQQLTHIAFHIADKGSHADVTALAVDPPPCLHASTAMDHIMAGFEAGLQRVDEEQALHVGTMGWMRSKLNHATPNGGGDDSCNCISFIDALPPGLRHMFRFMTFQF